MRRASMDAGGEKNPAFARQKKVVNHNPTHQGATRSRAPRNIEKTSPRPLFPSLPPSRPLLSPLSYRAAKTKSTKLITTTRKNNTDEQIKGGGRLHRRGGLSGRPQGRAQGPRLHHHAAVRVPRRAAPPKPAPRAAATARSAPGGGGGLVFARLATGRPRRRPTVVFFDFFWFSTGFGPRGGAR